MQTRNRNTALFLWQVYVLNILAVSRPLQAALLSEFHLTISRHTHSNFDIKENHLFFVWILVIWTLKENAIYVVSIYWSKVLSKPFILMQGFSKSAQKYGSYGGLNIFKMAVMGAAIFEALWRHTAQMKYAKSNYKGFSRIFLLQVYIYV